MNKTRGFFYAHRIGVLHGLRLIFIFFNHMKSITYYKEAARIWQIFLQKKGVYLQRVTTIHRKIFVFPRKFILFSSRITRMKIFRAPANAFLFIIDPSRKSNKEPISSAWAQTENSKHLKLTQKGLKTKGFKFNLNEIFANLYDKKITKIFRNIEFLNFDQRGTKNGG